MELFITRETMAFEKNFALREKLLRLNLYKFFSHQVYYLTSALVQ